ncbi:MAG: hypothetical protein H0X24_15920 [Ktedonobacterales bacterium]|nr:hypothetical protein [Ktedonobacterales bacterium]
MAPTDDLTDEELEAATAPAGEADAAPTKPKRGESIQLVSDKRTPTVDSVMAKIEAAIAAPFHDLQAFDNALKEAERVLRASRADLAKAINAAVSGVESDLFIINTKAVKVDDLLKMVVEMRAKLAESGLLGQAKAFSAKGSTLKKMVAKIKDTIAKFSRAA